MGRQADLWPGRLYSAVDLAWVFGLIYCCPRYDRAGDTGLRMVTILDMC